MLAKNATVIEGVGADVGVNLVGGLLPQPGGVVLVAEPGQPRATVRGHPAHHPRGREVLRLPADLPDAAVRLAPVFEACSTCWRATCQTRSSSRSRDLVCK